MPALLSRCGGGSFQVQSEYVDGAVTVPAGSAAAVPLAHVSGATLLDYTTPTAPVPIADGLYAFTGGVAVTGPFVATRTMGFSAAYATAPTTTLWLALATPINGSTGADLPWGGTVQLAALTGTIVLTVTNADVVARDFDVSGTVVKIG